MNKAVRNERRKISATYVNGIAIALIAIGGFAPIVASVQAGQVSQLGLGVVAVCIVGSGALHWVARRLLGGMEE